MWFRLQSTHGFFPIQGVSHEQAQASVLAFIDVLEASSGPEDFTRRMRQAFDIYRSVGWDGRGTVLFTGYYTPEVDASLQPTDRFRYPLYQRPADLVSDPRTGEVLGRDAGQGRIEPYPTRRELLAGDALRGSELVWLADPWEAYLVQVQGSARLRLTDGSTMLVGYAGSNGREYTSIGRALVREQKLDPNRLSLPAIEGYFEQRPDELERYMLLNDRFVFFKRYESANWPAGSLGFRVEPWRSVATDKSLFPRGMPVMVLTTVTDAGQKRRLDQFMFDQDTGGAIRAPGRADLYMGMGDEARQRAGSQLAEGYLYYLVLKTERVAGYTTRPAQQPSME